MTEGEQFSVGCDCEQLKAVDGMLAAESCRRDARIATMIPAHEAKFNMIHAGRETDSPSPT